MNEETVRERLRAALGESAYPPDLSRRATVRLAESEDRRQPTAWVLAVIAAAIAVAIVATIVLGSHALKPRATVPVEPPPSQAPGIGGCATFSQLNQQPMSVKMTSPTTGWAQGGLRTTDGGARWRKTSPTASLEGMPPPAIANGLYPPGFTDFYLDGSHAWQIRTYASATTCYDHAGAFVTNDGGSTWQRSADFQLDIPSGWGASLQLQFVDATNGWLWVQSGLRTSDFFPSTQGILYGTKDGGLHWSLVSSFTASALGFSASSTCPSPFGNVVFASPSTAWLEPGCPGAKPELLMSHDGGITWAVKTLPTPPAAGACPCWTGSLKFLNESHGIVEVNGNLDPMVPHGPALLTTSDGGRSWQVLPPFPNTGYTLVTDLVDAASWWAILTEPGWNKGTPTRDWLYETTDGGHNWVLVQKDLPMGYPVSYVTFFDAEHGLAVQMQGASTGPPFGQGTEILTTSDGGHTWTTVIAAVYP